MKRWLKGIVPNPREMLKNRQLSLFGSLLQDPNLWHLNRRSASGGFAVGLFMMFMPPMGQMLMAAAAAIRFRVNLPISVSLVWISNPLTIPPMFYAAYVIGALLLGQPVRTIDPHFWFDWHNWLGVVGPVLLGCLICGAFCSVAGYLTIQLLWRRSLMRQLQRRRARYARERADGGASKPSSSRQI